MLALPLSLRVGLRWCQPQAFVFSLFIWSQVSLPQLLGQAAPEKPAHPLPTPGFLTMGLARMGSWKCPPGPCRIKTPAEPHSDCVALGKRLEFSEPQFPLPVNLGGEVGHLRAY